MIHHMIYKYIYSTGISSKFNVYHQSYTLLTGVTALLASRRSSKHAPQASSAATARVDACAAARAKL